MSDGLNVGREKRLTCALNKMLWMHFSYRILQKMGLSPKRAKKYPKIQDGRGEMAVADLFARSLQNTMSTALFSLQFSVKHGIESIAVGRVQVNPEKVPEEVKESTNNEADRNLSKRVHPDR